MKKTALLLFIIVSHFSFSQEPAPEKIGYKYNNNFELTLSSAGAQSAGALSWSHLHSLTQKKRFRIGYGIRFTSQFGSDLYYQTAPAKLTSKQTGPQVLFSETYPENVDSIFVSSAQFNALNISIHLQYTIKEKFDIGFNIDAIGFSFGKNIQGKYIDSLSPLLNNSSQTAKPTSLNALLVSDNDIGSLNSELYFRYWFRPNWGIKIGASFLFTEYTTNNKLRLENDRWRNKALMGMIGISYSPFR